MSFLELDANYEWFVSVKLVDKLVKDNAIVFMKLASMKAEGKASIGELPVVCDFS